MIETLHIENIGIIDDITIDLKKGLNIITGETGAGKSLVVDAMSIICGNRFSKDIIKTGKEYCLVEIILSNDKANDNIVVSREISLSGKNKCKINGRLVTVNELKSYMSSVINIHGQNDNQNLLDENNHIKYLDAFCNDSLKCKKEKYLKLYNEYIALGLELKSNYGNDKERKRILDLLDYEIKEIDNASFKMGEEEVLEEKSKIMRNSEKIYECISSAENVISSNVLNDIDNTLRNLSKISEYNELYKKESDRLQGIYYELEDLSQNLYTYKEDISFDEIENNEVIKRLDLLYSLKRKYGNNIEEILEYKDNIQIKKEEIENMEEHLSNVSLRIEEIKKDMLKLAQELSDIRKENGTKLENMINKELFDLEMKNAKIKIDIEFDVNYKFNTNGLDKVTFKILTNIGDEFKALSKIASGGEISRVMLAIKKVLSETDEVDVLVFDEVDTGISGKAGSVVGSKLKSISKNHQVMCITHLGVVAAYADNNYYISKAVCDNKTISKVKLLDEAETINEIARISFGVLSTVAIESAKELRRAAVYV